MQNGVWALTIAPASPPPESGRDKITDLHTMLRTGIAPIAIRFDVQCQTPGHGTAQSPGVTVGWTASYHQPGERYMGDILRFSGLRGEQAGRTGQDRTGLDDPYCVCDTQGLGVPTPRGQLTTDGGPNQLIRGGLRARTG